MLGCTLGGAITGYGIHHFEMLELKCDANMAPQKVCDWIDGSIGKYVSSLTALATLLGLITPVCCSLILLIRRVSPVTVLSTPRPLAGCHRAARLAVAGTDLRCCQSLAGIPASDQGADAGGHGRHHAPRIRRYEARAVTPQAPSSRVTASGGTTRRLTRRRPRCARRRGGRRLTTDSSLLKLVDRCRTLSLQHLADVVEETHQIAKRGPVVSQPTMGRGPARAVTAALSQAIRRH